MSTLDIRDLTLEELKAELGAWGEPGFRAEQVFSWIQQRGAKDFAQLTNIPKLLRERLGRAYSIGRLELAGRLTAHDGAEKFLFRLADRRFIETVRIPAGRRATLCLSTQVGCKFGCLFCASGFGGFTRNLRASEIVGQVHFVRHELDLDITHLVFMGMGEPLDNFDAVSRAVRLLNHPLGVGLAARRMTISTCGLIPGIERLAGLGLQVELSVSLHAARDERRNAIMPVNKKYPLPALVRALKEFRRATGRKITFECTLMAGLNDSLRDADDLARLAADLGAKVNLIPFSEVGRKDLAASSRETARIFRERLERKGIPVTERRSKGSEIQAACGQLAGRPDCSGSS